jgi:AAA+ ATPase superfamily predicted ATPase
MSLWDRESELNKLDELARAGRGGLGVVWGRRRIGKTRLLLEWCRRHGGVYLVFDQSSAEVQRNYVAEGIAARLPGFADVRYPDWRRLLERLSRDAALAKFRGPIVFDELPYAVIGSPELPSVFQRWIDHDAGQAGLSVALSGSSQRMMQGLVLDSNAPLFGRAKLLLDLRPLSPRHLPKAFGKLGSKELVESWSAWGGVPRYWELARGVSGSTRARLLELVLDPTGALHLEPERLLLEEVPGALEVRPLLDAIGAGAHRLSEIAGRLGRAATSLARPLDRLVGMGLVRREVPFGEPDRGGKRSLYRIDDPFFRLWFRLVAPHRAALLAGSAAARARLLDARFDALVAEAWEDLARTELSSAVARRSWQPARRYWHGAAPEWDVVASSLDDRAVLVGEARYSAKPFDRKRLQREAKELSSRALPEPLAGTKRDVVRALFVPALASGVPRKLDGVEIVTLAALSPSKRPARR